MDNSIRKEYNKLRPKQYCEECGIHVLVTGKHNLEKHRINPSGPYTNENVKILCDSCHKKVHNNIPRRKFKN